MKEIADEIWTMVIAHDPGDPTGGDYLRYQLGMIRREPGVRGPSYGGAGLNYTGTITYTPTYYTSYAQEQELTRKIDSVLQSLDLQGKSDEQKVLAIYDYICGHVEYDYTNLNDDNYKLKYTAYAAMCNGTAVCQGYSNLLYRMLLEAGVDCRFISGTGNCCRHAWNIVRLGGRYYNVDSTWDSNYDGLANWKYFLRCDENFDDHARDDKYLTASFMSEYPMSAEDYVFGQAPEQPHEHTYEEISREGASCTGWTVTYECSECGDTYQEELPPTWNHNYVETSRTGAPCTGITVYYKCSLCGETYEDKSEPTKEHTYQEISREGAACTGWTVTYECSECGDTYQEELQSVLNHNYVETSRTGAPCTGITVYYACSLCGGTYVEAIAPTSGHVYSYTDNRDGTHTGKCDLCGSLIREAHHFVDGVCASCGAQNIFRTNGDPEIPAITDDVLTYKVDLPTGVEGKVFIAWYKNGQMVGCDVAEARDGTHAYDANYTYKLFLMDNQGHPITPALMPVAK
ncbi:MAG: hypothetical protein IIY90_04195 [Oscillospiraceae bacterium]|nr:hypothetical protein [Oscillospiraceae bacterium]